MIDSKVTSPNLEERKACVASILEMDKKSNYVQKFKHLLYNAQVTFKRTEYVHEIWTLCDFFSGEASVEEATLALEKLMEVFSTDGEYLMIWKAEHSARVYAAAITLQGNIIPNIMSGLNME